MNSGLCEHCLRVAYLVTDMTILLGMDEKATMDVQLAAIYHDIGKTQIPEQVLNKPGKLTPGEYFIENRRISLWNQLCFMTLSQIQKIRIIK